ncbi:MAG: InlB B-repeat-containing protein, partial [Ruminococcus sp.]|nr:InlB B-repeat-containing protein [Ruminococcus sp.]
NSYNVIFKDHDGTVLSEQVVEYGKSAEAPEAPTREGDANIAYSFKGWDKDFANVASDLTVTALYDVIYTQYTVTFVTWDGSAVSTQKVDYSKSAQAPADPTREGYLFAGWDTDFSYITGDLTVNATFVEDIVYIKGDFNGWSTNGEMKATDDNNIVSVTLTINPGTYGFKINRAHLWYSNGGTIADTTTTTSSDGWGMSTSENGNCTLNAFGGYYTFRFNKNTAHLEVFYKPFTYTVNFVDYDGTILKTESVDRGKDATAPDYPTRDGYVFTGWDVAYVNVLGDLTVTAKYREISEYEHVVTFKDWDGSIIVQMIVLDGQSAVAPDNPTREGDGQYDYIFKGWDTDFSKVTSDLTVTAVYTETARTYKVTFVNYDSSVISTQNVKHGKSATAPADPVRPANAQYTFTFAGWDTEFTNITSDLTVKATYTQKINEYTVTFVNWNGIVLSTQIVEYGKSAIAPKDPTRQNDEIYEYTFSGWDKDFTNVQSNLTVTAQYTASGAEYMVVFLDMEGNLIGDDVQYVMHGNAAVAPEPPVYEDMVFVGWDTDFSCIESDTIIFAEYAPFVAYLAGDFNDWDTETEMEIKDNPVISTTMTLEAGEYEFKVIFNDTWYGNDGVIEDATTATSSVGWEMTEYAGNCTLDASGGTYTFAFNTKTKMLTVTSDVETYTVTFVNYDGTVLAEEVVRKGADAEAPAAPTRDGDVQCRYVFRCWDADFTNVTEDMTVMALYDVELNKYTVTFTDFNGTVLSAQTVEYGKAAEAPAEPTREGYGFVGWDKDFSNITSDLTVTALYMEDIVYLNGDFNQWSSDITMSATETDNVVTTTLELNEGVYEFQILYLNKWLGNNGVVDNTTLTTSAVGWEMTVEAGNCKLNAIGGSYTFNFNKATKMLEIVHTPIEYTVTFKDWNGAILKEELVERGKDATAPEVATRDEYMFIGWDAPYTNIKADTVVNALYLQQKLTYTVTFLDWDGTILKTQIVNTGEEATAPEAPTREGYKFIGWNKEFNDITYNLYVHAVYEDHRVLLAGSFTDWLANIELKKTETENIYSGEVTLKSGKHHFKVVNRDVWYGNTGEIDDTTLTTSSVG